MSRGPISSWPGRRHCRGVLLLVVAVGIGLAQPAGPAAAVQAPHNAVVSAVPSISTPDIRDGRVLAIAKIGNKVIVGGTFTQVANRNGGATYTRNNIFAFDASTGNVDTAFAPSVNGVVNTLAPGSGNTIYAGGTFTTVNGATHRNLSLLNITNGALVAGFRAASLNGAVNDLALSGGRLYVGGTFSTAGGVGHGGLATLNPSTGALDAYMNIDVSVNHNWNGTGARAAVGVSKLDISPNGERLVVIGNFKVVEGLSRDQAVVVLLRGTGPIVDPNWKTTRYEPACFSNAFDSYIRDVDFAPDGAWFSIVATGGPNPGTLCDTATRWEVVDTGQDVQPRWIADSGGDTLFSVAITGTALYAGGHQRWMNNAGGTDRAAPGAVPRPGLAALDPLNGVPLSWNPGRHPRGVGAQALLATPDGLYVGSDTQYIGNFRYSRPRIAFFPLAGGTPPASQDTGSLPANVYLAGRPTTTGGGGGGVLHRVNTGGPTLQAIDGGPDWAGDTSGSPSPYRNGGSNEAGWSPVPGVDGTVPDSTPSAVFDSERWDPGSKGDGGEMSWAFPVANGTPVEVRLYFANRYTGTSEPGQRVFDVTLEGNTVLSDYDIRAQTPDQTGTMRSFPVTSDGTVNLIWGHEVENPLVNAIEIRDTSTPPPPDPVGVDDVVKRFYDGSTVSASNTLPSSGIEWNRARGGFMNGGKLIYGWSDSNLYTRTFDGTTFGPAVLVDPYNDPVWSEVSTGSGQTYRGVKPTFYAQLPSVTGMFYSGGRVFYTLFGQQALYYRGMSLDSLIVAPDEHTVPGATGWNDVQGMFLSGNQLYWASRSDGNLRRIAFTNGTPTGTATVVSGPGVDGNDWRTRAMFLGPGGPPQQPVASFTSSCTDLTCSFDASASTGADNYAWDFGDGTEGVGRTTSRTYAAAGSYTVTLTVTNAVGSDSVTGRVDPAQTLAIGFRAAAAPFAGSGVTSAAVTIPGSVQAGDALVLLLSTNSSATGSTPSGFTAAGSQLAGTAMTTQVWQRVATQADPGRTVTVTLSGPAKVTLNLLAYVNTAGPTPVASFAGDVDTGGTSHTTPTATAPGNAWAVSVWTDKSASARSWTAPGGVRVRTSTNGTGSGDLAVLIADSGPVPAGSVGGFTATVNAASSRATMLTIVIRPGT